MSNLAKESMIRLAGGDIGSLLGTLGQNASKDQIPPEMTQLLSELPKWTEQRASALDRIKQAYDQDPRMNISPERARGRAMFNNANPYDPGYSLAMGRRAEDEQNQYIRDSKIAREKAVLDALDLGTFDKLYSTVQKNMVKKPDWKADAKVIGDALVGYDPNTRTVEELYRNERNSPLYGKIFDQFLAQSINDKLRFPDDQSRLAWVTQQTEEAFAKAKMKDKTRIGSPDPVPSKDGWARPGMNNQSGDVAPSQTIEFDFTPDQLAKFKEPGYVDYVRSKIPEQDRWQFDEWLKKSAPTIAESGNLIKKSKDISPSLLTPEQNDLRSEQFKGYAEQHKGDLAAILALRNQAPSINVMKSVLSNPNVKYMSGPLHEQLVSVAGFMNYIDPNSSIVKAGDTIPSYFSNMMNLVRDKIKALGAGTAVSNLDLIITQKSVGDLRNTPEGNKKLLAIMELQNAVLNDRLQRKVAYFESNSDGYKGYEEFAKKFGNDPTHMITRDQNTGDYRVVSKDDWMKQGEAVLKNAGKPVTPENLSRLWKREADYSVAAMLKGTGVEYQGKKL